MSFAVVVACKYQDSTFLSSLAWIYTYTYPGNFQAFTLKPGTTSLMLFVLRLPACQTEHLLDSVSLQSEGAIIDYAPSDSVNLPSKSSFMHLYFATFC